MSIKEKRTAVIAEAIREINNHFKDGVSTNGLDAAKAVMLRIASQAELFPRRDFPIPDEKQIERTFLVFEDKDSGYAFYVNSAISGQQSGPHDHGGTWAIVAAVEGDETHRTYTYDDGELDQVSEMIVCPGSAIAMGPDGIHSIHTTEDATLLHLHLYGQKFEQQGQRRQFDAVTGAVRKFVLEDVGFVEDVR